MPANKKYLTKSPIVRLLKIAAGFFGGYAVSVSFHLLLARFFNPGDVLITAYFSCIVLWAVLLLLALLADSAWKIWLIYALLTFVFCIPFFN
ncbi:hypothetical protein [Parapedobacter sp.]